MRVVVLLICFFAFIANAQTPSFEVASIKPNVAEGGPSSIRPSPGRLTMTNVSLKKVMLNAWGIPDDREYMVDGPAWLTTEHFDMEATFPATTTMEQVRPMLQGLLADRFKLVLHRETRQVPNYTLVAAKGGPKIQPVEDGQSRTSAGPGRLEATKITMQKLADLVARQSGRPVIDGTGLTGVFSFALQWSPDASLTAGAADGGTAGGSTGPSVFTALQEQLGLRLESGKGPVEVLVVDRMEKLPTAN